MNTVPSTTAPPVAGQTEYPIGQQVRYIGGQSAPFAGAINHGAVGTVIRIGQILDDCPVVHFPTGTHGPHSDFLFITHDRDLEPVR